MPKNKEEKYMNKEKKRKKTWLIILILLLLIILIVLLVLNSCRKNTPTIGDSATSSSMSSSSNPVSLEDNGSAIPGGYSSKSSQVTMSELQKQQVTVTDKVNSQISFSSGSNGTVGSWVVENPSSNNVIEQCEVVLEGTTVAKSVPIYPGQHIESITLSQQVDPGNYDVTATISYFSTDTKTYLGKAGYSIRMSVS
jgi:hypothetical protein